MKKQTDTTLGVRACRKSLSICQERYSLSHYPSLERRFDFDFFMKWTHSAWHCEWLARVFTIKAEMSRFKTARLQDFSNSFSHPAWNG